MAILYLALSPTPPIPLSNWDKANHVFAFAVLGALGWTAWPEQRWNLAACLVAYGCAIELMQMLTATRQADWHDVAADVVGLFVAAAIRGGIARRFVHSRIERD
ncbi:VanZ family protein [Ramlibacter sp. WS9]|uniref:VanZ family protein n=1 Tax=Ramlibacter sp. WS9 TaxID=1882741 RepID=UPI001E55FFEC|nr:VanZ family protein [Ramlibacter sp. WS9]